MLPLVNTTVPIVILILVYPANCLSGTCNTICNDGFNSFDGLSCTSCPPLCKTCNLAGCTGCYDGYKLSGVSCYKCEDNCLMCTLAGCTACVDTLLSADTCTENIISKCRFYYANLTCKECQDGYYLSYNLCIDCQDKYATKCDQEGPWACKPGLVIGPLNRCIAITAQFCVLSVGNNVCMICNEKYKLNVVSQLCEPTIPVTNCEIYEEDKCIKCESYFYLDTNGNCQFNATCDLINCKTIGVNPNNTLYCLLCSDNYYADVDKCCVPSSSCKLTEYNSLTDCFQCKPNFFIDTPATPLSPDDWCGGCPVGCEKCTSATVCIYSSIHYTVDTLNQVIGNHIIRMQP